MKVFITKWWGSKGILEHEGGELVQGKYYSTIGLGSHLFVKLGKDAYENREAAVEYVKAAAGRKLRALKKKLVELEKIAKEGL